MENPAHVYTTGIPMSEKGNFSHNKHGCDDGNRLDIVLVGKSVDHDYRSNSEIILCDSASENVEFINNSIQDGFQPEILCNFVCDAALQSEDLPIGESASLEVESVPESDSHIKFSDSPGTPFPGKIGSFPSMEGLESGLDEQLDRYLSDFKTVNKSQSDDGSQSLEEEQRTVTEAISAIAKSFGLEDLLPDTFQVEGNKDCLSVTVASDGLCCDGNENIGELSLGDFEKCSELHSPQTPLNLNEHLDDDENYVLNSLELLSPYRSRSRSFENTVNSRYELLLKEDSKLFLHSKDECTSKDDEHQLITSEVDSSDLNFEDSVMKIASDKGSHHSTEFEQNDSDYATTQNACESSEDIVTDIPTVRISDVQEENSSETGQNCSTAGAVLMKRDRTSKKMQIVLTLDQGQKIYDIDTESVDASEQPLDLDFPTTFEDNLQDDANSSFDDTVIIPDEHGQISTEFKSEKGDELIEDEELTLDASNYVELVSNLPATPTKAKKGKTWVCPVEDCQQVLDKECKLRVHMISHKGARPFKCNFEGCDWAFTTPYRLRRHEETHLGSKDYVCDFEGCNRKFTTVYNLKTHKKRHKWPNSLTCPSKDCKMSFANRRKMELHLRVHKDVEAPYKCSLCGKQYYSANCIASHYRTHQYNEDDFKCPFQGCGKVYDKICRLRQHIRHHTGDRPYTCPAEGCKWSFMSASKLTRHMRKHTGERKFVCTEPGCGKSFMRPEHLKGHIVIHSGDKPFHCPHENCNARFTAKSSLYVHVKKHCPSVLKVVYPCPVTSCIKKYNSKATLKQHLQKFHPETFRDGKQLNIAEKLELTMPVSVVSPNSENSLGFLEFDEGIADDPSSDLKVQLFQTADQPLYKFSASASASCNSGPVIVNTCLDLSHKTVPKASKCGVQNQAVTTTGSKESAAKIRTSDVNLRSVKLFQQNRSGCARTDYCCKRSSVIKSEPQPNFLCLNQNSSDNIDSKSFLSTSQMGVDIKSPDLMLASSIMFHDPPSEPLMKSNFSPDESSTSHSLYHDDSILATSSTFGAELIPALLSDEVESDESSLTHDSSGVFSEQNGVDAFSDSIHLHLD